VRQRRPTTALAPGRLSGGGWVLESSDSLVLCSGPGRVPGRGSWPWAVRLRPSGTWQLLRHIPHARRKDPGVWIQGARYEPFVQASSLSAALSLVDQLLVAEAEVSGRWAA